MLFLMGFMVLMGVVDSLNPFTIAVHILLLGILKNVNRIAIYILGILSVYLLGGIAIFTGLSSTFGFLVEQFSLIPELVLYGLQLTLGVILVAYGLVELRKSGESKPLSKNLDVSTWALIGLGAGGTLSDLPTAIPYLGFIAKMTEMRVETLTGAAFLLAYCLIYILPLVVIWILYVRFRDRIRSRMELIVTRIEKANKYIIVFFCEVAGAFFILDAVLFYMGRPIDW